MYTNALRRATIMGITMKAAQYTAKSPEEQIEGLSVLLPLDSRSGFVFLLSKTRKQNADTDVLLQILSDQIHRLAESFGEEANAQHRFEQFLGALNDTLAQQVRDGRFRVPIEHLDALVGIACETQMFLSGTGELTALFLHRKPSQSYQVFNLFRGIQTEQSLPTWEKPFAVVLDGDLHEGDAFAICNQDLQRVVPADELNAILTTLPPIGATEKIRQYFSHKAGVLLIILKILDAQSTASGESRATLRSEVSIQQFQDQEEETQHYLEDQSPRFRVLFVGLTKWVKRFKENSRFLRIATQKNGIPRLLWRTIRTLVWNSYRQAQHLKTKDGRIKFTAWTKKSMQSLAHLQKSTKYLITGIVAIAIVLVISISLFSTSRTHAQEQRLYQAQVQKIQDTMDRAAGAIIYKDENQARSLYLAAGVLIGELPTGSPERREEVTKLRNEIQRATDEIRHIVTVPNPALLGDLDTLTDGIFGQSFVKINQDLYVFASDGRVYLLDRAQKTFKPASIQDPSAHVALSASADGEHVYGLTKDQALIEFKKDTSTQTPLAFPKADGVWQDLVAYGNRLYVLSQNGSDGQVYRFGKKGDTLDGGSKWITTKTAPLGDARAITIDGTVFVLKQNGKIARFVSGAQVEWETGVVDPPITNATNIWTDTNSKYLYVLEPDTKRIIVFQKDSGAFVVQYRSDTFSNLTDIIVDESAYAIYLLSDSKIYSIAPSHISR